MTQQTFSFAEPASGRVGQPVTPPKFDGKTFDADLDGERLATAMDRVYCLMIDGQWRTLPEISSKCGCSEAGASARLRDLRKEQFQADYPNAGVESRRKKDADGVWEYRMLREQREVV